MAEIIFDEAFMQQLEQLQMALALRLHEGMQGGRKSSAKGASLEFSDFREYGPGDDFRRIDWTAYGRLDKLFVKVFMEEKEAIFNIFVDQSKSMSFGSPSKGKKSLQIAAALSSIIMARQDRVNIRLLGGVTRTVPNEEQTQGSRTVPSREVRISPTSGKQGFHQLLERLSRSKFEGTEDICTQLLKEQIGGKGVSIILSDFLFEEGLESLEKVLGYLRYKKQHIILVQVLCKEERQPDELGDFEFIDSETSKKVRLSLNPKMLEAYQKRFQAYERSLEALALKYDAKHVMVSSEASIESIILKDFYQKQILF